MMLREVPGDIAYRVVARNHREFEEAAIGFHRASQEQAAFEVNQRDYELRGEFHNALQDTRTRAAGHVANERVYMQGRAELAMHLQAQQVFTEAEQLVTSRQEQMEAQAQQQIEQQKQFILQHAEAFMNERAEHYNNEIQMPKQTLEEAARIHDDAMASMRYDAEMYAHRESKTAMYQEERLQAAHATIAAKEGGMDQQAGQIQQQQKQMESQYSQLQAEFKKVQEQGEHDRVQHVLYRQEVDRLKAQIKELEKLLEQRWIEMQQAANRKAAAGDHQQGDNNEWYESPELQPKSKQEKPVHFPTMYNIGSPKETSPHPEEEDAQGETSSSHSHHHGSENWSESQWYEGQWGHDSAHPKPKEADVIKFQSFPTAPKFRTWRRNFYRKVASSSGYPKVAFHWINEVVDAKTMADLEESGQFETLDAKIANGLGEIISGEFQRKVHVLEEKENITKKRMLGGRQIAWLIFEHLK